MAAKRISYKCQVPQSSPPPTAGLATSYSRVRAVLNYESSHWATYADSQTHSDKCFTHGHHAVLVEPLADVLQSVERTLDPDGHGLLIVGPEEVVVLVAGRRLTPVLAHVKHCGTDRQDGPSDIVDVGHRGHYGVMDIMDIAHCQK